jgi:hypothetical protein
MEDEEEEGEEVPNFFPAERHHYTEEKEVPSTFPAKRHHYNHTQQSSLPPEWGNVNPDALLKCFKTVKGDALQLLGIREFYKSYSSWEKMTHDQRYKALSWCHNLPENWQLQALISIK